MEPAFVVSPYIAEFWNTLSNLPFVIIGLLRLNQLDCHDRDVQCQEVWSLYVLFVACGVCSAIHHASTPRWTIVIDWIPIATSIGLMLKYQVLFSVGVVSWFKVGVAFAVLVNDHVYTTVNVPWGHCFWHVLAAFSIDACYQDVLASVVVY